MLLYCQTVGKLDHFYYQMLSIWVLLTTITKIRHYSLRGLCFLFLISTNNQTCLVLEYINKFSRQYLLKSSIKRLIGLLHTPIQHTAVQSIELQGNRGCSSKSRQNRRGLKLSKLLQALVHLSVRCSVLPLQVWLRSKVVAPLFLGTAQAPLESGATPAMAEH